MRGFCDANGFVVLDRQACLERLAQHRVASLAITDGALPMVLPVLYVLHGEELLMCAERTGILGRRLPNSVVSLCVHNLDADLLGGWTVSVTGLADPLDWSAELAKNVDLRQWGPGESTQVLVSVGTQLISGREIIRE
jgi:uncharacterized protein